MWNMLNVSGAHGKMRMKTTKFITNTFCECFRLCVQYHCNDDDDGHIYLLSSKFNSIRFFSFVPLPQKLYKWINCVIRGEEKCYGMRAMTIAMSKFIVYNTENVYVFIAHTHTHSSTKDMSIFLHLMLEIPFIVIVRR